MINLGYRNTELMHVIGSPTYSFLRWFIMFKKKKSPLWITTNGENTRQQCLKDELKDIFPTWSDYRDSGKKSNLSHEPDPQCMEQGKQMRTLFKGFHGTGTCINYIFLS